MTAQTHGVALDTVLARRPDLQVEEFDEAILIWDDRQEMLHHLDLGAALVWEGLDGQRSMRVLLNDLHELFDGEARDRITADVLASAAQLVELGLLVKVD